MVVTSIIHEVLQVVDASKCDKSIKSKFELLLKSGGVIERDLMKIGAATVASALEIVNNYNWHVNKDKPLDGYEPSHLTNWTVTCLRNAWDEILQMRFIPQH